MYIPTGSTAGNGTGQGVATQAMGQSGLCGNSAPQNNQQASTGAPQDWMASKQQELQRLGGKPAPGNVAGTQPGTPSPLDASAPQQPLAPIVPPTPYSNPNRYVQPSTQGNGTAQGAGASALVKLIGGGGL